MKSVKYRKNMKKITIILVVITVSLLIINLTPSHSKLSKTVDSKNTISMKTSFIEYNYDYTGEEQTFIIPKTGNYKIELWGAGHWGVIKSIAGGSYVAGNIKLEKNIKLYIYIGGMGYNFNFGTQSYNSDAGGSSDVRIINGTWNNANSLRSRIIVAAGAGTTGGLNSWNSGSPYAGSGGGLTGYKGGDINTGSGGNGATQTSGTAFGYSSGNCPGGNGYYSGYAGYYDNGVAGGGGGSSFISGHNGCIAIESQSSNNPRLDSNRKTCLDGTTDITCSYHYSGYKFTDTVMIDGNGYNWTTVKGDYVGQPQPDGTTTTGRFGNGYARITYLGK